MHYGYDLLKQLVFGSLMTNDLIEFTGHVQGM
jgi:hypothetical protein